MTAPEQSAEPTNLSIQETRRALVSLYVAGSKTDAQALFGAVAGATEQAWMNLERILDPVNRFVIMGELPYVGAGVFGEPESRGLTPPTDPAWPDGNPGGNVTPVTEEPEAPADTSPDVSMSAADLIAMARAAMTVQELDAIEEASNGRVTVLDAVDQRRAELT
jgi:hypothetical protein